MKWQERLNPYAELWSALEQQLDRDCRTLSDSDLRQLRTAALKATQTNCWYATFAVKPMIVDAINAELFHRSQGSRFE